uniref:Uncharacterized protein n=1 Tax=Takifugu rubripes TaxID=31033 RepID=A0A674N2S0_TAKRU
MTPSSCVAKLTVGWFEDNSESLHSSSGVSTHLQESPLIFRGLHPSSGVSTHLQESPLIFRGLHPSSGSPLIFRGLHPSSGVSTHLQESPLIFRGLHSSSGVSFSPAVVFSPPAIAFCRMPSSRLLSNT